MKNVRASSKSGLFLIELIIAIVFFAVASAICIQLFVKAHLISTRSRDISSASIIAQNYAELYKAPQNSGGVLVQGGEYFSESGETLPSAEGAVYRLQVEDSAEDGLHTLTLAVYRIAGAGQQSEPVYTLDVKRYLG